MTIEDWTAEEQSEDTLTPNEWQDRSRDLAASSLASLGPPSALPSSSLTAGIAMGNGELLTGLASLDFIRQQLLQEETGDPLGIKDVNYIRQLIATIDTNASEITVNARADGGGGGELFNHSILGASQHGQSVQSVPSAQNQSNNRQNRYTYSITSTTFDALAFLRDVHSDTSFGDLLRGRKHLEEMMGAREEGIKTLVKSNFGRFVNARSSTDLLYKSLQERRLLPPTVGGEEPPMLRRAREGLAAAREGGQEVFGTLMARQERERALRRRLAIFERFDFVLSLGHRLQQYMRVGEYGTAVSEYRKTKSMINNNDEWWRSIWAEGGHVARTVEELRHSLFSKLANPLFSYEVHAQLLDLLNEIEARPLPVLVYYGDQKEIFFQKCRSIVRKVYENISKLKNVDCDDDGKGNGNGNDNDNTTLVAKKTSEPSLIPELIRNRQFDRLASLQIPVARAWKMRAAGLEKLAGVFKEFFENYGRFIVAFLAGRFSTRRDGSNEGAPNASERTMVFAQEFKSRFPDFVKEILQADSINAASLSDSALLAAYWIRTVGGEFCRRCQGYLVEVFGNNPNTKPTLALLTEAMQQTTIYLWECLWNLLAQDAAIIPKKWPLSSPRQFLIVKVFDALLLYCLDATLQFLQPSPMSSLDERVTTVLEAFIDGLVEVARHEERKQNPIKVVAVIDHFDQGQHFYLTDLGVSYRSLVVLANLRHLRQTSFPHLLEVISTLGMSLGERSYNTIVARIERADGKVRRIFLDARRGRLLSLVQTGTINCALDLGDNNFYDGDFDENTGGGGGGDDGGNFIENKAQKGDNIGRGIILPREIRPFVSVLLFELATVQSQILDIIDRTHSIDIVRDLMSELVRDIFQEYLRCIQMIRIVGRRGYWQLRAELDALKVKLIALMTDEAISLLGSCHSALETALNNNRKQLDQDDEEHWRKTVSDLVAQWDSETQAAFICFQL